MAVKDCDAVSNIMATSLIAWDDELAQEIARLSLDKRNALARARNLREDRDLDLVTWKPAHELELKAQSADIQLRAITQAKILAGEWTDRFTLQAREALAKEIREQHWTLAWWLDLLDKLRAASPVDYSEVARLWWTSDATTAIKEINEQISNFVASNYSIRQYSDFVNDGAAESKKLFREWKITAKQLEKDLSELHSEAMKAIKDGKNPTWYVKLDEERQAIKKMYPDNPEKQMAMWDQYVMAREILSDWVIWEAILNEFKKVSNVSDLAWELTFDQLEKYTANDLNKLLARAYTNTKQLISDSTLREAYKQKLVEVTSWMLATPTTEARIRSIINTLNFADQWATFSDVLKMDNLLNTCRRRGLDVSKTNAVKLFDWLKVFARNVADDPKKIATKFDIAWVEMTPIDAIQLIYDATWDRNIIKLLEMGQFDDWTVLDISTQYLLWNNRAASEKILALFSKANETAKITNIRDMALKTTTWVDIKEWARVWFFDFRKWLYAKDELNRARADFMDALANKNKMNIASWIDNFTENGGSVDSLTKALEWLRWWYLVVNDAKWKDNDILREAMDKVNQWLDEDSSRYIHVIFPNRAMSANFSMENGTLIFKTVDDQLYRDVSWTLSIQTLWQAQPTKEIQELAKESATWRDMAWNNVDSISALSDYGDKLDEVAMKYFGSMLWVSWKTVDSTYVNRTKELLSAKVWVDIKAFDQIKDRAKLWTKIDKQFALAKLTTGKYDTEVVRISGVVNGIKSLSNDDLIKKIKLDLGDIISTEKLSWVDNLQAVREAYINYKIAATPVDSMWAKGRIISLMNGGEAPNMSIDEIKNLFQNPSTMGDVYKRMFFPNQEVSKGQMAKYINQINNGIFDSLSATFADNLVNAWYALPLVNIKTLVYDFLTWNVDLNTEFVQAFLLKNNINASRDSLNVLLNTLMPAEYKFGYEWLLYQWAKYSPDLNVERAVVKEVQNQFTMDSYSAIWAVEMARKWDVPSWYERKFLEDILNKYYEAFKKWLAEWIDFQKAQAIKQEASYALDMFEQDFLMSRYGRFLTSYEKQWFMGMKYSLPIAVSWQNVQSALKEISDTNQRLLKNYDRTLKNVAKDNDINAAVLWAIKSSSAKMDRAIESRRKLLMEQWAIIKEVNWQYLVYDSRQALKDALDTLPKDITGLEQIKSLWSDWIKQLTNPQAYSLLRYIEAAKWLATKANYVTELMYKQNPLLLKYAFFDTFKIGPNWLPRALNWNTLLWLKELAKLENSWKVDEEIKKAIFKWIKEEFNKNGYLEEKALKKIIATNIEDFESNFLWVLNLSPREIKRLEKSMALLYKNAFIPYTYLRDLPVGWVLSDDSIIPNIKDKVKTIINQQYQQAIDDLKAMWYTDIDRMQDVIQITLSNGETKSLRELANVDIDSWKDDIFNDESIFIKAADEIETFLPEDYKTFYRSIDKAQDIAVAKEKERRDKIVNGYNSTIQSMSNWNHIVSEAENKLLTSFMHDVRATLKKSSLTNMIVDASDALAWLNEEAARWMKDYLIWFTWQMTFWAIWSKQIMERYAKVKNIYAQYYSLGLDRLNKIKPTNKAEDLALKLAKYFKTLEQHLWSADWAIWCTTHPEINRAFYHIGEVFNNLKDTTWIFGMLSAIEQNQILKFFKFSNPSNLSYVEKFVRKWAHEDWWLWGYRDYVTDVTWITQREFNEIFGSAFTEDEFKQVLQGLTWFTITGPWWRRAQRILNFMNGSNFIFRLLMSYPWQIFTIPWQSAAYFLKQKRHEWDLWMETMSEIDAIRSSYKVLDWAYNEINLWWKSIVNPDDTNAMSFYNRYWIPDVDRIYRNVDIQTTDDYLDMYAKIDDYATKNVKSFNWWKRQLDPYKDNANNIIDWLFARNFKNVAFGKALKENDFLQFSSARAFKEFMDNPNINDTIKAKLMQRVNAYSWRNFRNILWLGFWWLDRAVGWGWLWNIFYWLMQFLNFRWAWWQNIFKQTGELIWTMYKMIFQSWNNLWSKEGRDAIAKYIASQPEFMNFVWTLYNDLVWTWRLQRFQDNGQWTWETEYDALDFINYFTDTLNMTSQRYQWIQSFWPMRPFIEMGESRMAHLINPTIYKDTWWVWAFFNALGKNAWRQWKPYNWIAKAIWAWTTDWRDGFSAYVQNKFWELSFGSLRYMAWEDLNSYGYTYEMTWQVWWIPSILMWEAPIGSDKNFSYELDNNETWETMEMLADWNVSWDDKWTYLGNLKKTLVNGSQFFSLFKNVWKAKNRRAASYFTADDLAETIQKTKAWMEFYQKWYVTPSTPVEARMFIDAMLANGKYRPWSSSFNNSLMQFEEYWHMNGKKEWNPNDEEMEFWLSHMKYETRADGTFVTNKNWKVEDEARKVLVKDIRNHFSDQTYCKNVIYSYATSWLNAHSSDPNYQLYVKMLGQWAWTMLIEKYVDDIIEARNVWKKWADNKWSEDEFKKSNDYNGLLLLLWNSKVPWEDITFFDKLQVLDQDASTLAALEIIENQTTDAEDKETLSRFYTIKKDDNWEDTFTINNQYRGFLTQVGSMSRALSDWNIERFISEAASLTHQFKNDDPVGAITASIIDSVYRRIYDTDSLTPLQKQEAMIALFHDNKEFIQHNGDMLKAYLWNDYDEYARLMNEMLYQWDWELISNLESIYTSWEDESKTKAAWVAAAKMSSDLKSMAMDIGWVGSNGGTRRSSSYWQWVPVTIKWANLVKELWLDGYTPEVNNLKLDSYKPHSDFSISKDTKRKIKTTTTQTVSSKKQLSDIEKKTQKALEAES